MSDRKYKQRGYQDSGREERSARRPQGPRDTSRGPRGRGLGKPSGSVFKCAVCGKRNSADELRLIAGKRSNQIPALLGKPAYKSVVHRDNMVLLGS